MKNNLVVGVLVSLFIFDTQCAKSGNTLRQLSGDACLVASGIPVNDNHLSPLDEPVVATVVHTGKPNHRNKKISFAHGKAFKALTKARKKDRQEKKHS